MKHRIEELALFGGKPLFSQPLHVGCPNIPNRELINSRLDRILRNRWLTNDGPHVQEFESKIEACCGVRNCVCTANGTLALQLAVRALELKGEVILPSFTFVATPHALSWEGITPVFCDVEIASHTIDPQQVQELITDRTSAILGVHVWGMGCEVEPLEFIARRNGLALLFDAAQAFGCTRGDRMIGSFGHAEVLSFHATKFVNCFEGGAVLTNDDALAEKIRLMRNFGFAGLDTVTCLGINAKMSEISAAMGLASLDQLDEFRTINERNHEIYGELLRDVPGLTLVKHNPKDRSNYQYVVLEVNSDAAGMSRDLLVKILVSEGILARRYFFPGCHRMQPYASVVPRGHLPRTEWLTDRVLQLPTGTAVGKQEIAAISQLLRLVTSHAHFVRSRLDGGDNTTSPAR